jgi:hypothetical protein
MVEAVLVRPYLDAQAIISRIRKLRESHNFQVIKKEIGERKLCAFLNHLYPKYDIKEIEKITGVPDSTLERWFTNLRLPFIRNHISNSSIAANFDSEIVLSSGNAVKKVSAVNITPQLAYVIGFALGDGSVQKYMVEVFNKDAPLIDVLHGFMKRYGTASKVQRKDGLYKIRLSSGLIANLIRNEKNLREDTLDYIFGNDELARNFIAAFWDAEGTVRRQANYYHLYLYNSNELIMQRIKEYLTLKDIKFSILTRSDSGQVYFYKQQRIISRKPVHRINIHKVSWQNWIDEVGKYLLHSKKKLEVKKIQKLIGGN